MARMPFIVFPSLSQQSRVTSNRGQGTYGNLDTVIGEDEGRVGASELGSRHGGRRGYCRGTGESVVGGMG